ncbi:MULTISPECIES: hypothetical protein [Actinomadura]|jgi:hypothetical protein|uniref:Nematocidal protein AidA n=1 Tax=Actinomadura geliboluensis TaxID=882440 RepID=A0A5S4H656_9ACTN|nr:hypothetical protein [Actinomadura geliboluensis]TMR40432.1 hypothetical protein ETD96_10815 [Actinomadura geliboluensis]
MSTPRSAERSDERGQLNSVQLNIVTLVNMERATSTGSLDGALFMMDNSLGGTGQGTDHLETICKQGQVINWIIRPVEMEKRPDGTWPPMPKISNLVFLDTEKGDEEDVAERRITTELKIYGAPDLMRSPYTPVYYYWAGAVQSTARPGLYHYRFVLELEQDGSKQKVYLSPKRHAALRVLEV